MDETTAKQRIAELKQLLERYNEEYYVQDAPTVTDYEYDMLMRELETLEGEYPQFAAADSPTRHVGGTASRKGISCSTDDEPAGCFFLCGNGCLCAALPGRTGASGIQR